MKKGYTLTAGNLLTDRIAAAAGEIVFVIGSDGKVKSGTPYKVNNYICTPGKEVFILLNEKTGKTKRAKKIFVIHSYGDM